MSAIPATKVSTRCFLPLGLAAMLVATSANAITLTPIATGFNNPVGIDHHAPTNKVVMSVHYSNGQPYNFELVAADGTRAQFSSISGFTDEVKIGTARTTANGFTAGELFTGTGVAGRIARISPDGATVLNPWVTLPAEPGLMRGSLHIDRTGVWGGDLIVVTTAGGVWRVTAAGVPTKVAQITTHLEGLVTVPDDTTRYGPWAGKILIGAEAQTRIYSVSTSGSVTPYNLGIQPEDIEIVPANENFFGVDFGGSRLMGAPPSEFAGMVGDVVIAQEFPGILWRVRWNGSNFEVTEIARVGQWEHVTFSTAGVPCLPPVCTIEGTPYLCGGQSTRLCGPLAAGVTYLWSGPNGLNSADSCIDAVTAGLYTLTLTVPCTGRNPVSSVCSTLVVAAASPTCTIDGPTVIPPGQTIQLCGTSGYYQYSWSTTLGGFIDTTRCITVDVARTYYLRVTDRATGCSSSCSTVVVSNRRPNCSQAAACVATLWPPNHRYQPVSICGVTDPDSGDVVTITVSGITQDEPLNTRGDGNTCPDGQIVNGEALVRAERSGTPGTPGNGRVYIVSFTASDGRGGECKGSVSVCVPHDQGNGSTCIDDGKRYNSLGPCTGGSELHHEITEVALNVGSVTETQMAVEFSLPGDTRVELIVFDVAGRRMATVENGQLTAGTYQRTWDMSDARKGLYFVRLRAGAETLTRTVVKIR